MSIMIKITEKKNEYDYYKDNRYKIDNTININDDGYIFIDNTINIYNNDYIFIFNDINNDVYNIFYPLFNIT